MSAYIQYSYLDKVIEITSEDPSLFPWLDQMLTPWFSRVSAQVPSFRISVDIRPEEFQSYLPKLDGNLQTMEFAGMDGHYRLTTIIEQSEKSVILYDSRFESFYFFDYASAVVRVLRSEANPLGRMPIYFLLREYVTSICLLSGLVPFHTSAAFIHGFGALAFAGPKNSGKTSILCSLLLEQSCAYITNDRAFLDYSEGKVTLIGVPTIVNIRRPTAYSFPEVLEKVEAYNIHSHRLTTEELEELNSLALDSGIKLRFSTAQFCGLFNHAEKRAGCAIEALVFPAINEEQSQTQSSLQLLGHEETRKHLAGAVLRSSKKARLAKSFQGFFSESVEFEQAISDKLDSIAKNTPSYSFSIRDGIRNLSTQLSSLYTQK
jgi:hypothetical protein